MCPPRLALSHSLCCPYTVQARYLSAISPDVWTQNIVPEGSQYSVWLHFWSPQTWAGTWRSMLLWRVPQTMFGRPWTRWAIPTTPAAASLMLCSTSRSPSSFLVGSDGLPSMSDWLRKERTGHGIIQTEKFSLKISNHKKCKWSIRMPKWIFPMQRNCYWFSQQPFIWAVFSTGSTAGTTSWK